MSVNLPELLQKYLRGDCSKEETAILIKWYKSFEGSSDPLSSLTEIEAQEVKARILGRIKANIEKKESPTEKPTRKIGVLAWPLAYWLSGVAAVVLIVTGLSLLIKNGRPAQVEQVTVNNLTGKMYKVTLSDSSVVWLSPDSKLQYPKFFKGDARMVSMDGEAFFEVTKDAKHPFVINSGDVVTKVIGTSFRIRAYQNSRSTEVSVVTGKVSVSLPQKDNSEVMILPSYKVTYLKDRHLLKKNIEEKSSSMQIWEKTTMSFENAPVSEVMLALNQKFGVQMTSEDNRVKSYVLNADFTDQSLPAILEILEKTLDITYKISDKKILLNKKI
jgi:transmembrane sensor